MSLKHTQKYTMRCRSGSKRCAVGSQVAFRDVSETRFFLQEGPLLPLKGTFSQNHLLMERQKPGFFAHKGKGEKA
jgi:hypothetical protein